MDKYSSDSDDELFQSAEESLDEDDERNICGKSEQNKRWHQTVEVEKPAVSGSEVIIRDGEKSDSDVSSRIKNSAKDSVMYRKRPDKTKNQTKLLSTKPVNTGQRNPKNDTHFKTNTTVPDNLLVDIKANLSKNINKSLNTIQKTSSNVKDMILSTLPAAGASEKNSFSYDETVICSPPSEGPASTDDALTLSLPLANVSNIVPLDTMKQLMIDKISPENSGRRKNIIETGLFKFLKGDTENEHVENKLFTKNTNKFDIPDVGIFLSLTENKQKKDGDYVKDSQDMKNQHINDSDLDTMIVAKNSTSLEACDKEKKLNLNSELAMGKSHKHEYSVNFTETKTKNKYAPSLLPLEPSTTYKNDEEDPDVQTKQEFKVVDGSHDVIVNPHVVTKMRHTNNSNKLCAKKKCKAESKDMDDVNDNLVSLESCYAICEQLKHSKDFDETNVSEKTYNLEESNIDLKDPISGWIKKTSESDDDVVKKDQEMKDEERRTVNQNDIKNETPNVTLAEVMSNSAHKVENTEKNATKDEKFGALDVTFISKNELKHDGWDDFDFSDSEDLDVTSSNEPLIETRKSGGKNKLLITNKLVHSKESKQKENTGEPDVNANISSNRELRTEIRGKHNSEEKDDDWNWDDWGDEEDKKGSEETNVYEQKRETEKGPKGELWSGWDTFGQKLQDKSSQSNWGSWGVNLLLDKASAVTQGLSSALESSLGVPDAQTLARMDSAEKKKQKKTASLELVPGENSTPYTSDMNLFSSFGITNLVAGVTSKIVDHSKFQEIGSKVITGGLDTLESFGKKTMEVLQEGDPGLRTKRALLLGQNQPVLSQVLREIREKTEKELKEVEKKEFEKKCHFESTFDDYQGLVHLEALKMLSKQCELKLEQIRNGMNDKEQEDLDGTLEQVQQLCSLEEYDLNLISSTGDFNQSLKKAVIPLKEEISIQKIFEVQNSIDQWLLQSSSEKDLSHVFIQQKLVSALAQLTAAIVHQFHKAGELLAVKECRKTVEEIDALSEMTHIFIKEISNISNGFISLSKDTLKGTENLVPLINKIDLATKNSTSYIKEAFNLLIPVLQVGAAV